MAINLRPHSTTAPFWIEKSNYDQLVKRTTHGWSHCTDETEWLAKLHYLRTGLQEGKLLPDQFKDRETRLVRGWIQRRG